MSRKADQKKLLTFGLALVIVAVVLHANQLVLESRIIEETRPFHADLFPGRLRLFLLIAFLFIGVGVVIQRRAALVCALLGFVGVFAAHIVWLLYSNMMLHELNVDGLYERHPELRPKSLFGFVGARWWDVVIVILSAALCIWLIKTLVVRVQR